MSRHRETRHRGAGRRHELRPLSSGSRPRRRNRAARHAEPLTIEWDARGTFHFVARAGEPDTEPAVTLTELTEAEQAALVPVVLAEGTGWRWLWPARPARPWVQPFPHRRGHSSRPGSSRRRR